MSDIVQVIADVLASVDDDVYRGRLADRGTTWEATSAQYNADMAELRALRDLIEEDRKAFLELGRASAVFSDGTGYKITLTDNAKARDSVATERALLAFCREVGT